MTMYSHKVLMFLLLIEMELIYRKIDDRNPPPYSVASVSGLRLEVAGISLQHRGFVNE